MLCSCAEKGYEQRSERDCDRYWEGEMDLKSPSFWWPASYAEGASEAFRTVSPRRIRAFGFQQADGGRAVSAELRRRSVPGPTRRKGCPSRDDAMPGGSGEREKERRPQ